MADRKLIVEVIGDTRSLERGLKRSQLAVGGFSRGVSRGLLRATAAVTGITVGVRGMQRVLVGSVKSFAEFETSMQRIVGLAGGAQSSIAGLSDQLLTLAPQVGKGPKELGDALYFVASAGIVAGKQMSVVDSSARAAAAGLGTTQSVADAVTSAMNAYGQSLLSAGEATDVLVATVREGKGEAAAFAPVIGNVAALAAQLGVAFSDVGAALAAQTRLGIDAQTASVQLQQVFSNLLKVAPQAEAAFKSVGLSSAGLRQELKARGLLAALDTLRQAFAGNTVAMAHAFPNIRALRGLLALVGKNAEDVRGVFHRLSDTTGDLDKAFGAVSQTATQKFARASAAIEAAEIRVGAALAPLAEQFAGDVGKIADSLSVWLSKTENTKRVQKDLNDVVKAARDVFVPLAKAIKTVSDVLGGTGNAVELLLSAFVVSKVLAFTGALTGLGTEALVSAARVKALRLALLRLGAIGLITLGVEVILHRRDIERKVDGFLRRHGAGFLTGKQIEIPVGTNVRDLEVARARIAAVKGEGDLMVKTLDIAIARFRSLDKQRLTNVETGLAKLSTRLAAIKGKTVKVTTVESGLDGIKRRLAQVKDKRSIEYHVLESGLAQLKKNLAGVKGKQVRVDVIQRGLAAIQAAIDALHGKTVTVTVETIRPDEIPGRAAASAAASARATAEAQTTAAKQGTTIIARITRQATAQKSLNRELAESITRAEHLKDLIRQDPKNTNLQGRLTGELQKQSDLQGQIADASAEAAQAARQQRLAVLDLAGAQAGLSKDLQDDLAAAKTREGVLRRLVSLNKGDLDLANQLVDATQNRRAIEQQIVASRLAALDLAGAQAALTKSSQDDLSVAKKRESVLRHLVRLNRDDLDLANQLVSATAARRDIEQQIAANRATRVKGRQFQALGLTETGEAKTPGVGSLLKRARSLTDQVKGTALDTPKTRSQLASIVKVLKGAFGKAGKDVRAAILAMINAISGALKEGGSGKAASLKTAFKKGGFEDLIRSVTGLTPEQVKQLRSAFSQFGPGGSLPGKGASAFGMAVSGVIPASAGAPTYIFNGDIVTPDPEAFERHIQRKARRTRPSRRGTSPGVNRGLA